MQKVLEWAIKNWVPCLTALVALYGAFLSTINLLNNRKDKIRKLRVETTHAFRNINEKPVSGWYVRIINPGFRPITVDNQFFFVPGRKCSFSTHRPETGVDFPYELKEGTSCEVWTREEDIRDDLKDVNISGRVKVLVGVTDQTGKLYIDSNPIILELK